MRIPIQLDLSRTGKNQDYKSIFDRFQGSVKKYVEAITSVLNGQVSFGNGTDVDNLQGRWVNTISPAVANTDFTVDHNLGRVPVGFIVISVDKAAVIYTGTIAWTTTQMTLKASAATVALRIFVI